MSALFRPIRGRALGVLSIFTARTGPPMSGLTVGVGVGVVVVVLGVGALVAAALPGHRWSTR